MRIGGNGRVGAAGARGVSRHGGAGAGFSIEDAGAPARAANVAGPAPAAGIEALLALQAVEDPVQRRRRQVRRARDMLDTLEEMKADLLVGRLSEGRLNRLMALITQARERGGGGIDAVIDDVELRVRVELAKRGYFPAG